MKAIITYQNTKPDKEDFLITPALFGIWYKGEYIIVFGIGIVWGWYAIGISIGRGIPKNYPIYKNFTTRTKENLEKSRNSAYKLRIK